MRALSFRGWVLLACFFLTLGLLGGFAFLGRATCPPAAAPADLSEICP